MAVYRFRVTFEDFDDVHREVEIKSVQSFGDLNECIQSAIGFDGSKPASFYMSDDHWKKGLEVTSRALSKEEKEKITSLNKARLLDYIIDPHQKIYYVFDPVALWCFHIELVKIIVNEETGVHYPRVVKSVGEAPKQYGTTVIGKPVPEEGEEEYVEEEDLEDMETESVEATAEEDISPEAIDEFNLEEAETEEEPTSDTDEI